jgi:O-succinylbenzoic acid--CoA ligase
MELYFPAEQARYAPADVLALAHFPDNYQGQALRFCQQWLRGQAEFVVPTSGSTGVPKPTRLARVHMEASARQTAQALGLQPGDRALVCLHPAYIAGLMMLVRGLVNDWSLTVVNPSAQPLAQTGGATFDFTALVPLQLQALLNAPEVESNLLVINQMKAILIGGAPLGPALEAQLQVVAAPLYATYGMTETVSHVALRRLNGPLRAEHYTALPGVHLSQDARGCLVITAPMTGGKNLITNDLVQLHSPETFTWLGRADLAINSAGVKVHPEKVEQAVGEALATLAEPPRFAVVGLPDERLGEKVVLAVEGAARPPDWWAALRPQLVARLGRYELPQELRWCPAFPQTATGKLDRAKLRALLAGE